MKSNYWLDKCSKEEVWIFNGREPLGVDPSLKTYQCPGNYEVKGPDLSSEFCPRKGILTRYGKKLIEEGAKFYSRMSITDFVI